MAGTAAGAAKRRANIETGDVEAPSATTVDLASNIAIEDIDRPELITVTDEDLSSPFVKQYTEDLAFNEDVLTISVAETTEKNAENPVPCGCNGEVFKLVRGQEYKLKRKFVDSLIRVEENVVTEQYKDSAGVDQTRIIKNKALKYPVRIHHDPANSRVVNGKRVGDMWFQHQCKNAW